MNNFIRVFIVTFNHFIVIQAEGYWTNLEEVLKLAKVTKDRMEETFGQMIGWWTNVCVTALAVIILELLFKENEDEWSLLRDKAVLYVYSINFHMHHLLLLLLLLVIITINAGGQKER